MFVTSSVSLRIGIPANAEFTLRSTLSSDVRRAFNWCTMCCEDADSVMGARFLGNVSARYCAVPSAFSSHSGLCIWGDGESSERGSDGVGGDGVGRVCCVGFPGGVS